MRHSIATKRLFVDTWGWVVLADDKHPAYAQADLERRSRSGAGRLVTTDYVLDETITRLFARCHFAIARQFTEGILASERAGFLRIERITPERFRAAYQLRLRYTDKPRISLQSDQLRGDEGTRTA